MLIRYTNGAIVWNIKHMCDLKMNLVINARRGFSLDSIEKEGKDITEEVISSMNPSIAQEILAA